MKKFSLFILAALYLFVCSGVAINVHYCMGKQAYVDLNDKKDNCAKCGMKSTAGGCCKHSHKLLKLDDIHNLVSSDINIYSPYVFVNTSKSIFNAGLGHSHLTANLNNHSPPWLPGTSLCIVNCVFRI